MPGYRASTYFAASPSFTRSASSSPNPLPAFPGSSRSVSTCCSSLRARRHVRARASAKRGLRGRDGRRGRATRARRERRGGHEGRKKVVSSELYCTTRPEGAPGRARYGTSVMRLSTQLSKEANHVLALLSAFFCLSSAVGPLPLLRLLPPASLPAACHVATSAEQNTSRLVFYTIRIV